MPPFLFWILRIPKQYGIVEGDEVEPGIIRVKSVVEKPEKPKTHWAIMAMYVFQPAIFKALETTKPGKNGEIQLTDAIQKLIDWGLKVYAVKLDKSYSHLDIGSPERYWEALELSHQQFCEETESMMDNIIKEDIEKIKSTVKGDAFAGKKSACHWRSQGLSAVGSAMSCLVLAADVTAVDDLSTGRMKNIDHLTENSSFKFVKSDVCTFKSQRKV